MAKYTLADEIARKAALNQPRNYGKIPPSTPKPVAQKPPAPKPVSAGSIPPTYNASNSKGSTPPSLGYGGATYGSSGSANKAISSNQSAIKNSPSFSDSEIQRTQAVIAARKAAGLDTSGQEKYLNVNLGYTPKSEVVTIPPSMPPQATQGSIPPSYPSGGSPQFSAPSRDNVPQIPQQTPMNPVRDAAAIEKYVNEQIAAELLRQRSAADQAINAGRTTANQQTGALKTQYDRVRQNINDDRVLQNLQFERNHTPFSGQTDYAQRGINTERERSDREMSADLATRQSNVTQGLTDLENSINAKYKALQDTSGADRQRLIQSITQDERQYELAMRGEARSDILANGQLYNDEFTRALQGYQANRGAYENDRDFGYGQYRDNVNWTGNIPGGGYGAQSFGAQGSQGGQAPQGQRTLAGQAFDRGIYESDRGYDRDVFESDRDFGYQEARDKIMDTRYKAEFERDTKQQGLEFALEKAVKNHQMSNDDAQLAISRMNANTSRNSSNNAAGNANFNKLMDVWRGTGKAPTGLQGYGIQPGAVYEPGRDSGGTPKYDQTPEWAGEIAEINAGTTTYDDIIKNSQVYIETYTYPGYQKLLSAAKAR